MTERQLINDKVMQALLGDDDESILEFKQQFLVQSAQCLMQMKDLLISEDLIELGFTAHFLKTSAQAIGAEQSAHLLAEIEQAAKHHKLAFCTAHLSKLERLHHQLYTVIYSERE